MTALPRQYAWLENETGPKMIVEFLRIYGVKEVPGRGNNEEILAWAKEIGVEKVYTADSIPWCGLEMGVIAKRAGKEIPKTPLWALSWADFGVAVPKGQEMLGDVLTFKRDGGGHVGLYIGEDEVAFHVGAGNQSDASNITRIAKNRLYAARRPIYSVQPANVRKIHLAASGALSKNKA